MMHFSLRWDNFGLRNRHFKLAQESLSIKTVEFIRLWKSKSRCLAQQIPSISNMETLKMGSSEMALALEEIAMN